MLSIAKGQQLHQTKDNNKGATAYRGQQLSGGTSQETTAKGHHHRGHTQGPTIKCVQTSDYTRIVQATTCRIVRRDNCLTG